MFDGLRADLPTRSSRALFGAVVVVVVCLGWFGFGEYFESQGGDTGSLNRVYAVLTLFVARGLLSSGDVPLELEIAQLLAPLLSGYAALRAVRQFVSDPLRSRRARKRRGHTVVIGAGETGMMLLRHVSAESHGPVVVLESDPSEEVRELCRRKHWSLVVGNAQESDSLRRCAVGSARRVFVATGRDDIDMAVARSAREEATKFSSPFTQVRAVLDSPELCHRFVANEWTRHDDKQSDGAVALEFVDRSTLTCAAVQERILEHQSAIEESDGVLDRTVLIGGSPILRRLQIQYERADRARQILGVRPASQRASVAVNDLEDLDDSKLRPNGVGTTFVVEHGDSGDTSAIAAAVAERFPSSLVVALSAGGGDDVTWEAIEGQFARVVTLDPTYLLQSPAMLTHGPIELMARLIHLDYSVKEGERAGGDVSRMRPAATKSWHELDEHLQESNRAQALSMGSKLRRIGCELEPGDHEPASLTTDEIELLAREEHERWWAAAQMPSSGSGKPYDELTEELKQKDRDAVVRIPALAALLGYTLKRREPAAPNDENES